MLHFSDSLDVKQAPLGEPWPFAYEMLGGIVLLVSLPSALSVTEAPSTRPVKQRQIAASAARDARPADALRQFRFWALAAGFGAAMFVGRLGTGLLIDRYFAPYVAAALMGASTAAIAMLAHGVPGDLVLVAAFLVGISAGSDGDVLSYLVARYFGLRSFATLSSLVFAVYLVGTSIFPWLTGLVAGRYGGYGVPMLICTGLGAACVASMLRFGFACNRPLQSVSAAGNRYP